MQKTTKISGKHTRAQIEQTKLKTFRYLYSYEWQNVTQHGDTKQQKKDSQHVNSRKSSSSASITKFDWTEVCFDVAVFFFLFSRYSLAAAVAAAAAVSLRVWFVFGACIRFGYNHHKYCTSGGGVRGGHKQQRKKAATNFSAAYNMVYVSICI